MSTGSTAGNTAGRGRFATALLTTVVFLAVIWVVMVVNALSGYQLTSYGVRPHEVDGLWGILVAPFIHVSFDHLLSNTPACAVLLFLVALSGPRAVWVSSLSTALVGGLGSWRTGPEGSVHVGASILIYGWAAFLVLRGFIAGRLLQMVLGVVVAVVYAGMFWGMFPGQSGVSWQGHLFGAVGGGLAAFLTGRGARRREAVGQGARGRTTGRTTD